MSIFYSFLYPNKSPNSITMTFIKTSPQESFSESRGRKPSNADVTAKYQTFKLSRRLRQNL